MNSLSGTGNSEDAGPYIIASTIELSGAQPRPFPTGMSGCGQNVTMTIPQSR